MPPASCSHRGSLPEQLQPPQRLPLPRPPNRAPSRELLRPRARLPALLPPLWLFTDWEGRDSLVWLAEMAVFRWILLVLAFAPAAFARDVEIPFPVRKSTTASRDGATYIVEGRQRIGMGVTISVKQNTRILGRGEDPAGRS